MLSIHVHVQCSNYSQPMAVVKCMLLNSGFLLDVYILGDCL